MTVRQFGIGMLFLGALLCAALVVQGKPARRAATAAGRSGGGPPAGDYPCLKSSLTYSTMPGPGGPMMQIAYNVSALGTLTLDGRGGYKTYHSGGRYAFSAASGVFAFISGPLQGWPVAYEVDRGQPMLRLAATKEGRVVKDTKIGEHLCQWKSDVKLPDTAPKSFGKPQGAAGGGAGGGRRNGAFRGTLTFHDTYGSNAIVDVDIATGKTVSRFEGDDPHRSAAGETAFVNSQSELVIAGKDGVTAARIALDTSDDRPDGVALSPDGQKVAYHVAPVYYDSRVIVTTRGGKRLAEFKDMTSPDWTPDGRLVLAHTLTSQGDKAGLFVSDSNLSTLKRFDPNLDDARTPAVSPDGKRVAFVYQGHLWAVGLDGTGLKQITTGSDGEERPAWSPDGQSLAAATKKDKLVILISVKDGRMRELKNPDDRTMQSSGRITWR